MARGTESKNKIFKKLQEIYSNAFWEDEGKILRIPVDEGGEVIEVKVTLTAAKNNLGAAVPASAFSAPDTNDTEDLGFMPTPEPAQKAKVTEEEKEHVAALLASLGF